MERPVFQREEYFSDSGQDDSMNSFMNSSHSKIDKNDQDSIKSSPDLLQHKGSRHERFAVRAQQQPSIFQKQQLKQNGGQRIGYDWPWMEKEGKSQMKKESKKEEGYVHPNRVQFSRFRTAEYLHSPPLSAEKLPNEKSKSPFKQSAQQQEQVGMPSSNFNPLKSNKMTKSTISSYLEDQLSPNKSLKSRTSVKTESNLESVQRSSFQPLTSQISPKNTLFAQIKKYDSEENTQNNKFTSPTKQIINQSTNSVMETSQGQAKQEPQGVVEDQSELKEQFPSQQVSKEKKESEQSQQKRVKYFQQRVKMPQNYQSLQNQSDIARKESLQYSSTAAPSSSQLEIQVTPQNGVRQSQVDDVRQNSVQLPNIDLKSNNQSKRNSKSSLFSPLHEPGIKAGTPSLKFVYPSKRDSVPLQLSKTQSVSSIAAATAGAVGSGIGRKVLESFKKSSSNVLQSNSFEENESSETEKRMKIKPASLFENGSTSDQIAQSAFRRSESNVLNDSLLTSYDVGCLQLERQKQSKMSVILNPQKPVDESQKRKQNNMLSNLLSKVTAKSQEDGDALSMGRSPAQKSITINRRKRDHFYIGTGVYEKIKRVYVRTVDPAPNTFETYFTSKNFKFEWISGEVGQKEFFYQSLKKNSGENSKLFLQQKTIGLNLQAGAAGNAAGGAATNLTPISSSSSSSNSSSSDGEEVEVEVEAEKGKNRAINGKLSEIRRAQTRNEKMFVNKKNLSRDKQDLVRFGVAVCSRKGYLEEELPNQDNYIFYKDQLSTIYAILDGHGPFGHAIGSVAYRYILIRFLSSMSGFLNPSFALKAAFNSASAFIDSYFMQHNKKVNQFISGTSCTFILNRFNTLTIAHVGDTKAYVFKKSAMTQAKSQMIMAVQLTDEHIPSNMDERKRIYNSFGEVRQSSDMVDRIYVRGRNYPGLHITRSIGDQIAEKVGVTSEPLIKSYEIEPNDHFLILGSASFFELIPAEELWSLMLPFSHDTVFSASKLLQTRIKYIQMQNPKIAADTSFVLQFF